MVTWNERSMPIVFLKEYYISDGKGAPCQQAKEYLAEHCVRRYTCAES